MYEMHQRARLDTTRVGLTLQLDPVSPGYDERTALRSAMGQSQTYTAARVCADWATTGEGKSEDVDGEDHEEREGDHAIAFRWELRGVQFRGERRDRHRRPGRRRPRSLSCWVWARSATLRPKTRDANPDPVDAYRSDPASWSMASNTLAPPRASGAIRHRLSIASGAVAPPRASPARGSVRISCVRSGASISGAPCSMVPPMSPMIVRRTSGAYPPRPSDVVAAPMGIGAQCARPTNRATMPSKKSALVERELPEPACNKAPSTPGLPIAKMGWAS